MSNLGFNFGPDVRPLAARMRPGTLNDYIGQQHLLSPDKPLYQAILAGRCHSLILWGPPGVGKTTLAQIIANHADASLIQMSAVTAGVKDIREAVSEAKANLAGRGQRTLLFVDEVHRFNKSQQDAFLPHIEDGTFIFVGATTENPSFALNNAILSRARVYVLKALEQADLFNVIERALREDVELSQKHIEIAENAKQALCQASDGDARKVLNLLEQAVDLTTEQQGKYLVDQHVLSQVLPTHLAKYDKGGDEFYDLISAFHKSVRGSSPDGALYWYCRILAGGGDPLYVARRLLAIATEDIGNADPRAMEVALNAWDIFQRVGPSEGERAIAQATIYLASAPKSNAVYMAFNQAMQDAKNEPSHPVPEHLRNAPTSLMKDLGYGAEYRYAHNEEGAFAAGEKYFPEAIHDRQYYFPTDRGLEQKIKQKLDYLTQRNEQSDIKRYE
ncbi:replication-associated recombination protein A [Pseudoalteromonas shioyasakiensis]|uniref:Replication-associated recombination protein A n=1 Tax=Pseudoalteromonas shioyasakiensis TaxID=1190813 RepID=A0ABT6TZ93_9GAMM|nr:MULTISPECIES: replication-associated recombination protein A [Pseudoalteromonas]MDI4668330.1 replication-associated recombination protein A [Pseudoalteromonas shioyasakiensis]MDI4672440.1 replication-associated recombination protein A [Pseudoalteromonas shioyasakiensis]MDI4684504.1 replication-associated recombination protein A [Pseudoalteromonas shioyasakiensis]MDI4703532.1 replication-associated recombination protein A [Pseudoalteromonas shioyasakiensis]NUJ19839.1 replication-associated r